MRERERERERERDRNWEKGGPKLLEAGISKADESECCEDYVQCYSTAVSRRKKEERKWVTLIPLLGTHSAENNRTWFMAMTLIHWSMCERSINV
jgi:mRNA deadenylase 3'-5' endonuclease subunit Ccr4